MRTRITLECTECKQRNYNMTKDKKTQPERMECPSMQKWLLGLYTCVAYCTRAFLPARTTASNSALSLLM